MPANIRYRVKPGAPSEQGRMLWPGEAWQKIAHAQEQGYTITYLGMGIVTWLDQNNHRIRIEFPIVVFTPIPRGHPLSQLLPEGEWVAW